MENMQFIHSMEEDFPLSVMQSSLIRVLELVLLRYKLWPIAIVCLYVFSYASFYTLFHLFQITPAHDPNDFEVGKRHSLEFINIFTDDGKINSNGSSEFVGMPRFKARQAITEALQQKVQLYALH